MTAPRRADDPAQRAFLSAAANMERVADALEAVLPGTVLRSHLVRTAAGLIDPGHPMDNPEYQRGMVELIVRACHPNGDQEMARHQVAREIAAVV